MNKYFLIYSAGRTATQWLAKSLNLHEQIYCSHGPDLCPNKIDEAKRFVRIQKELPKFLSYGADKYMEFLESHTTKSFVGNVHGGINIVDIYSYPQNYKYNYALCYLIRHPISRIESFINRWKTEIKINESSSSFHNILFTSLHDKNKLFIKNYIKYINFNDIENIFFINALFSTIANDRSVYITKLPYYVMERFTTDIEYFASLILHITGGHATLTEKYFYDVCKLKPVDFYMHEKLVINSYKSWKDWQKNMFFQLLHELNMLDTYKEIGYDLSWYNTK